MTHLEHLKAAAFIAERAAEIGLPPIRTSHIDDIDLAISPAIWFIVDSLTDLAEWAKWMEEPITSKETAAYVLHRVVGCEFDVRLRVTYTQLKPSDAERPGLDTPQSHAGGSLSRLGESSASEPSVEGVKA